MSKAINFRIARNFSNPIQASIDLLKDFHLHPRLILETKLRQALFVEVKKRPIVALQKKSFTELDYLKIFCKVFCSV